MKQLNYQTLQDLNYDGYLLKDAPERILQFGEGNFMRAFVDFFIDKMNETADFNSKVVLVQPIPKFTTPDVGDFINEPLYISSVIDFNKVCLSPISCLYYKYIALINASLLFSS